MEPSDPKQFRTVLGHFATGITVVTTKDADSLYGLTVNSFTSVSINPPLVLVCVDKKSKTHGHVLNSGVFAVSVLAIGQEGVSKAFSRADTRQNKLEGVSFAEAKTGAPFIRGCLAYLDCKVVNTYEGGDHTIFLGEVVALGLRNRQSPLVFYAGKYTTVSTSAYHEIEYELTEALLREC